MDWLRRTPADTGRHRAALAALERLSPAERACVELRLGHRLPIDEVASMLDVAVPEAGRLLLSALRVVGTELRTTAVVAR